MDEQSTVEFLSISFRSEDHMYWFQFSMLALIISVVWAAACAAIRYWIKRATPFVVGALVPGYFTLLHLVVSVTAVFMTKGGQVNGPLYSVDCIWFNALMAGVQGGLCIILGFRAYSLLPKTRKKAPRG